MRHLRRQPALFADANRLAHAVEHAERLVAHVRDVNAAVPARDLRQLDHFFDRRERARHVEQPGAHAERAGLHAVLDEAAHLVELGGRRPPVRAAEHRLAHRSLPDERPDVDRFLRRVELVEKRPERHRRSAVGPFDQRRDALPDVIVRGRQLEDVLARVVVDVDEPGRHDLAVRVDHARRRLCNRRRDARDRVAAHRDVGAIPRAAGAVDDAAVADDEIVGRGA